MKYSVVARNAEGAKIQGEYEAESQVVLIANLKREGLTILRVMEVAAATASGGAAAPAGRSVRVSGRGAAPKKSSLASIVLLIVLILIAAVLAAHYWGVEGFKDGPVAELVERIPGLKELKRKPPQERKELSTAAKPQGKDKNRGHVSISVSR